MPQCAGKSKQSGEQCKRHATPGHKVCVIHGSGSPQAKAAAERRQAQAQAEVWLLENIKDAPPITSLGEVYAELMAVAGTASVMRKVMQQRVSELSTTSQEGLTGKQVEVDVLLLERSLDRSAKVMDMIARLGIDERKQRLDEQQGQLVADVIRSVLDRLVLSPEQWALVPTVVPEELRALESA